jgi:preprotein translocase subunit SecA
MTGTARSSRREFRKVYKMQVVRIPTRLPSQRKRWRTIFRPTERAKLLAIRDEVIRLRETGRPVLIGSRSVAKSEMLSRLFAEAHVPHQVLNARHEAQEAEIDRRFFSPCNMGGTSENNRNNKAQSCVRFFGSRT